VSGGSGILAAYFYLLLAQMVFLCEFQDIGWKWPLGYRILLGLCSMATYFFLANGIWKVAVALANLGKGVTAVLAGRQQSNSLGLPTA
jgi:hypothetical protein